MINFGGESPIAEARQSAERLQGENPTGRPSSHEVVECWRATKTHPGMSSRNRLLPLGD
jgi:hypothetical protein